MSSVRAVFITYSSALVISVMELRRRQGTRNMPFLCVAWVSQFPISEVSPFGFQGRICILSRRGRMFRRIWRLTQCQSIIQWQIDLWWLSFQWKLDLEKDLASQQSYFSDFVCHYVSVWGSQGHVEDYHAVHHHHRGHWHHKHQIPAVKRSQITWYFSQFQIRCNVNS